MNEHSDTSWQDIDVSLLPDLDWSAPSVLGTVNTLFRRAEGEAREVIAWYLHGRQSCKKWSRTLRATAIVFFIVGGLVPLVDAAAGLVASEWGYVLLAIGAGCLAFDRFFGFSQAWIRFIATQFALQRLLVIFQHEWSAKLARLAGRNPNQEEVEDLLETIRNFSVAVTTLVEEETSIWTTDLLEQLSRLERTATTEPIRQGNSASSTTRSTLGNKVE